MLVQALSHAVRALKKLHSFGYAHRDIKPGNILRRHKQHDWTLIDFGCTAEIGTRLPPLHQHSRCTVHALSNASGGQLPVAVHVSIRALRRMESFPLYFSVCRKKSPHPESAS